MGDGSNQVLGLAPVNFAVVAVIIASAALLVYHFIVVLFCKPGRDNITRQEVVQTSAGDVEDQYAPPGSSENSIASLIPACKYSNEIGLVSKSEDVTCAVCLNEFCQGEAVKVLPECLHTFHVPCIDAWLNSHINCPICRTDTVSWTVLRYPPEAVVPGGPGSGPVLREAAGLERASYPASHGILVANALV